MRPGWSPDNGTPNQWEVAVETFSGWPGAAVLVIVILSVVLRRKALYKLSALTMVAIAVAVVWIPLNDREIAGAIQEGCEAVPELAVAMLISIGIVLAAIGRWSGRVS